MKASPFQSVRKESAKTRFFRWGMNLYPMFVGTGGQVTFISADWQEVYIRLKLNLWTRNYVRTIFGGSMFSASDPFYMLMLMHTLGKSYVVWDKAASIRFKRPGKQTLYSRFLLEDSTIEDIRQRVKLYGETEHIFMIQWVDRHNKIYAEIERVCYIAEKAFYKIKQEQKRLAETKTNE